MTRHRNTRMSLEWRSWIQFLDLLFDSSANMRGARGQAPSELRLHGHSRPAFTLSHAHTPALHATINDQEGLGPYCLRSMYNFWPPKL